MYTTHPHTTQAAPFTMTVPKAIKRWEERRFCPSISCLTDEIVVRQVSAQNQVWLLTDENEESTWLSMGEQPVCPHCGTALR